MSREIDKLIAEHVFGYAVKDNRITWKRNYGGDIGVWQESKQILYYSTDIAAAWEVVEKLDVTEVEVRNRKFLGVTVCTIMDGETVVKHADESAPLAICLAALKAKGIKVE